MTPFQISSGTRARVKGSFCCRGVRSPQSTPAPGITKASLCWAVPVAIIWRKQRTRNCSRDGSHMPFGHRPTEQETRISFREQAGERIPSSYHRFCPELPYDTFGYFAVRGQVCHRIGRRFIERAPCKGKHSFGRRPMDLAIRDFAPSSAFTGSCRERIPAARRARP